MERANQRRWLVSAAIVLLFHAGIAVAVLTWRQATSKPPVLIDLTPAPSASEPNGTQAAPPAAPLAGQTAAQQAGLQQSKTESASASASGGDRAEHVPPAEQAAAPNAAAAAKVEQNNGPAETSPGANAPQLPSSPQGAEAANGAGGTTISGGRISRAPESGGPGGRTVAAGPAETNSAVSGPLASNPAPTALAPNRPTPNSPMANMPLDTSITVQPPVHGNTGVGSFERGQVGPLASREAGPEAGSLDQRPTSVFRSAKPFGVPDVPRNSLLPNGNPALPSSNPSLPGVGPKNAPGADVQDRARAATARAISRAEAVKNAIGTTVTSNAVANSALQAGKGLTNGVPVNGIGNATTTIASRGDANGLNTNGVERNAIGVTANFRPRIPRINAGESKAGAVAVAGPAMPTAPIINGRDLTRPIAGPSVIGGPAQTRRAGVGMISGTDFHLRRP